MHAHEPPPDTFDFAPKYVWREVYQGRWRELSKVQKAEFAIELVFFALLIGGFTYGAYAGGNFVRFVFAFAVVSLLLGAFFWLLRRMVR